MLRPAHISLTIRFHSSVSVFKLASNTSFLPRTRSFRLGILRSRKGAEDTFTSCRRTEEDGMKEVMMQDQQTCTEPGALVAQATSFSFWCNQSIKLYLYSSFLTESVHLLYKALTKLRILNIVKLKKDVYTVYHKTQPYNLDLRRVKYMAKLRTLKCVKR